MSTKRQHYVPKGYLRGFAIDSTQNDSLVWVYDKRHSTGIPPKQPKSIKSICYEDFYYAQEDEDGNIKPDDFEKAFHEIENKAPQIIRNLDIRPGSPIKISGDDKGALAFFMGISFTRVPSYRSGIELIHERLAEMGLQSISQEVKGPNGEDFYEMQEKYGINVKVKSWVSLAPMVDMATRIGHSALTKNWQFFTPSQGMTFVTGDNPVHFDYAKKLYGEDAYVQILGPIHPHTEIILPLRKDLTLVCTPQKLDMAAFQLSPQETRKFNRGIARAARRYVIADHQSDALARLVNNHKDTELKIIVD